MKITPLLPLILTLLCAILLPAEAIGNDEIDWKRAKSLHQKKKSGETLSDEDSAYLKKAIEARTGTAGDGSNEKATVAPVEVSTSDSPVQMLSAAAEDGNKIEVAYRVPKAEGALPAVVFFHGGLNQRKPNILRHSAVTNPTHTRFLNAGYVSVSATFRTYLDEPLSRGPILDAIAIVQAVKKLPEVDPERVIIFGGSGGGNIALELASEKGASPLAVVAGEPATVLYTGLMSDNSLRTESMKNPQALYTDERRAATEKKIAAIFCPILIHHGDQHPLKKINFEMVFPAIEKAEKTIVVKKYPGQNHGFYWGNHTDEETVELLFANTLEFLAPLLKTAPTK